MCMKCELDTIGEALFEASSRAKEAGDEEAFARLRSASGFVLMAFDTLEGGAENIKRLNEMILSLIEAEITFRAAGLEALAAKPSPDKVN